MALKNLRFTVFHKGSPVVITLKPGQSIEIDDYSQLEEGYSASREIYTYSECGQYLYSDFDSSGSDCDGPMSRSCQHVCEPWLDNARNEYGGFSDWKRLSASQYDVYAEMMGY